MPTRNKGHFPTCLTTNRLNLKRLSLDDVMILASSMLRESGRYEGSFARTLSLVKQDPELYFQECQAGWEEGTRYRLGVWREGLFVGVVGLRKVDWTERSGELFYFVTGASEGQGLALEATNALVVSSSQDHGLSNLWLRVVPGNERSAKLAQRLGFEAKEILPTSYRSFDGEMHDTQVYRLQNNVGISELDSSGD